MKRKLTYGSDEEDVSVEDKCESDLKYASKLFEPIHFLRCHSKVNDAADVQTQVWQCAFEPDVDSPGHNTNIVATCGGNSVCFIDVVTGKVAKKFYSEKPKILLFSLAWTTLRPGNGRRFNILAVGGSKCYLQLILPSKGCSLLETPPLLKPPGINKASELMSCLAFHPSKRSVLFCGGSCGGIAAYDIADCHPWGDPSKPKTPLLLFSVSAHSEIFTLSISKDVNFLLSGCNSGLFGWALDEVKWENKEPMNHQRGPMCIEFQFPESTEGVPRGGKDADDGPLVDSVVCLPGSSIVATKCALRGLIYLWDLKATIDELKSNSCSGSLSFISAKLRVRPIRSLRWSDTDDYFMSMGCSPDGNLLACGDDEGGVWLYNLSKKEAEHRVKRAKTEEIENPVKEPYQRLLWPTNLEDPDVQNARKVKRLEGHGGVIDQVSLGVSHNGSIHLAAVTSTNLVCIWRAFDEEDIEMDELTE